MKDGRMAAVARLARELLDRHGLGDWTFGFNRRKRACGLCWHGPRRVELSEAFVRANDDAAVRDVLLHEIAHALAGHAAGHGPVWKQFARAVGANPSATVHSVTPPGRWQANCPHCGHLYALYRRPKYEGAVYYCNRPGCGQQRGSFAYREVALP